MGQFSVTFSYLTGSDLNDIQQLLDKRKGLRPRPSRFHFQIANSDQPSADAEGLIRRAMRHSTVIGWSDPEILRSNRIIFGGRPVVARANWRNSKNH